jgi:hypothetical protein
MPPITDSPRISPRPPEPRDLDGVGPGLEAYAWRAPTHPYLGWTPPQVLRQTQGLGRPLADVLGAVDSYGIPQRGLNGIPGELFTDSRIRIEHYIKPLQAIPERFNVTAPGQVNNPQAWLQAAQQASQERNAVMDNVREMISDKGLRASRTAKSTPPPFEKIWLKAATELHAENPAFAGLPESQRTIQTAQRVIQKSGAGDPTFNALVHNADDAARGLKALKYGGRALMVVGAVVDGVSIVSEARSSAQTGDWTNTGRQTAKVAGGWLGAAAAGAAVGTAAGTIVPGLGNVAGFLVGAAAGAAGYWLGSQAGEAAFDAAVVH